MNLCMAGLTAVSGQFSVGICISSPRCTNQEHGFEEILHARRVRERVSGDYFRAENAKKIAGRLG